VLTAAGHARVAARCAWPVLPVAIAGYLVTVPRFGAMGAAVVTGAAAAVGAIVALAATRATIATCLRGIVIAVPAYLAAASWPTPGAWWFLKVCILSAGVAALYLALGECSGAELSSFARAVRSSRHTIEGDV
jgi:hypothetical protein